MADARLVWSDDPAYTGTQTVTIKPTTLPYLSPRKLDDLREKWIDKYVVPKATVTQLALPTRWNDWGLELSSADMVKRAKEAARG